MDTTPQSQGEMSTQPQPSISASNLDVAMTVNNNRETGNTTQLQPEAATPPNAPMAGPSLTSQQQATALFQVGMRNEGKGKNRAVPLTALAQSTSLGSSDNTPQPQAATSPDDDSRELICLVENDSNVFQVKAPVNTNVMDLKKLIHLEEDKGILCDVNSSDLILWKLKVAIAISPARGLTERIKEQGEVSNFAEELDEPIDKVLDIFPQQPPGNDLHIIAKLPATVSRKHLLSHATEENEHAAKRPRESQDEPNQNLCQLHKLFWGVAQSPHFLTLKTKIPNLRTLETDGEVESDFTVIKLPNGVRFPHGHSAFLVTTTYETFWNLLSADDEDWQLRLTTDQPHSHLSHATVIKGQPGIGKTVFLSYVLVRRLQARLVTIYSDDHKYAYVFNEDGVRQVDLKRFSRITELDTDHRACALVNLGDKMEQAPLHFYPSIRRGRVVIATLPNPKHLENFSREHIASTYCMPTCGWSEVYCSSLLFVGKLPPTPVDHEHNERLRDAYTKFRGIPRRCFYTFSDDAMTIHTQEIQSAINNISSMEDFIRSTSGPMPFPEKASSKLVRIEPETGWRTTYTELLSDYIAKRVFDRIALYKTITVSESIKNCLSNPDSRGYGGKLFEQAVHRKFRAGVRLDTINLTPRAPKISIDIIKCHNEADGYFHTLAVRAAKGSRAVHNKYLKRYLIPISKTKESVDAVWISKSDTVFFQMTVKRDHGLKGHGVIELLAELPQEAKKHLCIVWVVPDDDERTKNFKLQKVTFPIGTPKAQIQEVSGYHQYLCYYKLEDL